MADPTKPVSARNGERIAPGLRGQPRVPALTLLQRHRSLTATAGHRLRAPTQVADDFPRIVTHEPSVAQPSLRIVVAALRERERRVTDRLDVKAHEDRFAHDEFSPLDHEGAAHVTADTIDLPLRACLGRVRLLVRLFFFGSGLLGRTIRFAADNLGTALGRWLDRTAVGRRVAATGKDECKHRGAAHDHGR